MGTGKKVLKVATIIAGILILGNAIARFVKILDLTFSQTLLTFYMV